jgi:hypothetical protein
MQETQTGSMLYAFSHKRGLLSSPLARPPAPAITEADKVEVDFLLERTAQKCRNAGVLPEIFA